MLLVQRGKELGYKMTDEDFNRVVTRIRTDNKLDTDEAFHAALKQEGMTIADLRTSLEKQMLVTARAADRGDGQDQHHRGRSAEVPRRAPQGVHPPGKVTIREILVRRGEDDKGVNVGLDDEAKAKAEARASASLGGEAFEQVAGEVSTSRSRANGGLVGPLNPAELTPALQELLEGLKPGDVSDVIRTPARLPDRQARESQTADKVMTAEEARDQIADAIFEQKRQVEFKKVPREAARAGDHRVEERRNQEGVAVEHGRRASAAAEPTGPPPPPRQNQPSPESRPSR